MKYFIQSSQPDRIIEYWDVNFGSNSICYQEPIDESLSVFDYIYKYPSIFWDWSKVRRDRMSVNDIIYIYFSQKIKQIKAVMKVNDIIYDDSYDRPLVACLQKCRWIEEGVSDKLNFKNLQKHGLKNNLQNLTEITNNDVLQYINQILN